MHLLAQNVQAAKTTGFLRAIHRWRGTLIGDIAMTMNLTKQSGDIF